MTQPATTTSHPYQRLTALSDLATRYDAPDDRSGGLNRLCDAAKITRDAYDELDYATDHAGAGAAREILRQARDAAYETWQGIERGGLPLLQEWQRESLGYSADALDIAEAEEAEAQRRQRANFAAEADGRAIPYPSEY